MKKASANVFEDLGFQKAEADNLRIRTELMVALRKRIASRELTQAHAATLLGVSQPRISDLVRGKIDLFSIDTLVNMLSRAGAKVTVGVKRSARAA
jgi:predicted XRE-type DNA-binding protein